MKKFEKIALFKITTISILLLTCMFKTMQDEKISFTSKGVIKLIDEYSYYIHKELTLDTPSSKITVPKGFKSDLSSLPKILRQILPQNYDKYIHPFIVHDYLYHTNITESRLDADRILYQLLIGNDVSKPVALILWASVRLFSGNHYNVKPCRSSK